ncbi:MAG: hypothetical protein ABIU09_05980 [Pyrinomonadaceae bacterium]
MWTQNGGRLQAGLYSREHGSQQSQTDQLVEFECLPQRSVGYQSYVNRSQYQYFFQQGFQRGYQDGSNSRYQEGYNGSYEYGSNENGTLNILGTILNQVLNIQNH